MNDAYEALSQLVTTVQVRPLHNGHDKGLTSITQSLDYLPRVTTESRVDYVRLVQMALKTSMLTTLLHFNVCKELSPK